MHSVFVFVCFLSCLFLGVERCMWIGRLGGRGEGTVRGGGEGAEGREG